MALPLSKTPAANHRRPLPFRMRRCAQTFGQSLAKVLDHAFPQPLWKPFGEHAGEDEESEESEEQGGGGGGAGGDLFAASWVMLGLCLGASWGPLGGLLGASLGLLEAFGGFLGASLAVLGRSWPV